MTQFYQNNKLYEIWTPNGWENFEGIIYNQNVFKPSKKIKFDDNSYIISTDNHRFFIDKKEITANDIKIGQLLDSEHNKKTVICIEDCTLTDTFDIFNSEKNVIYANDLESHQCDEMSFIAPRIAESFWSAMAPTLATGGRCIITSTPNSDEDKFAEIWFGANKTIDEYGNEIPGGVGINDFKAFTCHYSEVPGRDEAWAAKERAKIGNDKFDREYGLQFLVADESLINAVSLLKLQGVEPIFKTNEIRWYNKIEPNKTYVVALDPSAGVGKDPAAIEVFSLPDMKQVAEWTHNRTSIANQVKIMQNIVNFIYTEINNFSDQNGEPEIYFTVENNSWGEAALMTIADIGEERFNGIMMNEPKTKGNSRRKGFNTNGRTKSLACTKLKSLIENEKLKIYSKPLVRQLKFFVSKGDSFAAKSGENDDCVMATLLCIRMMQMITSWDENVERLMKDDFGDEDYHVDPMPISFGW